MTAAVTPKMTIIELRDKLRSYVYLTLRTEDYRILGEKDFGDHWRVRIIYRDTTTWTWTNEHMFAINHEGSLVWECAS